MKIERFEDIEAWQPVESLQVERLAYELTRKVYRLTKKPGFAKDYGLKRQIQDAAGSSMHNIAEGFDSETNAEFIRFLRYAKRSCTEVQSELYVDPVGKAFRTGVLGSPFRVPGCRNSAFLHVFNPEPGTQNPGTQNKYISPNEFKDVYGQARRTRAAVRGFINYLKKYGERKVANREP